MTELALLLFVAAVGYGLSRWSGVPVVPLLLGLGMLLSFSGVVDQTLGSGGDDGGGDSLFFVLELGLTVLVFVSGVQLSPQRFRRQRRPVLWVGLTQFGLMGLIGYAGARWLGYNPLPAVYLGFAVSASSTLVVLRQLQMTQQVAEPHGRMVLGVLLLQDGLTVGVLVALSHWEEGAGAVLLGFLAAAVMLGVAWLLQWRGARWVVERCEGDEESLLLLALSLLFLFLGACFLTGLPLVVGALLAGYSLSSFPVSGLVGGLLQSLVDFFRAIFFVALGALVVLPSAGEVAAALVLALLVMVLTPPLVAVVAEWSGLTSRPAIESGVLLAQTSEYSLMLGLIGMRLEHLSPAIFGVIALMAVVTMTCTPLLARDAVTNWLLHWHPLRNRRKLPGLRCEGHVLMLGLGSAGMYVLRPLRAAGVSLVVVDDDPAVIAELDALGIPCVRGDGADEHTLERVGAAQARVILALMRRVADARTVLRAVKDVPVLVRVFEDTEARLVERLGGIPVSNAEAALEALEKSELLKTGP